MKWLWLITVLIAVTAAASLEHQTSIQANPPRTIIVQVLNGKTGKPIKGEAPNIWIGNVKDPVNPRTDSKGEIALEIGQAQPAEIRVMGNYYMDCRRRENQELMMNVRYSLTEIIAKGVVSENGCGQSRTNPIPGKLILYMRPMTFKEKWDS